MHVLISANGPNWDATIAPAFEDAPYWLLVDSEANSLTPLAGTERPALQYLAVQAIVTGHVAAETGRVAQEHGIAVYTIPAGGVRIALQQWRRGRLKLIAREQA